MKRLGTALALMTLLTGSALAADQTVELKLSHWVPPAHPLHPALQAWADDIEKASGGTIKSTLFPSEQLGKAFDHYDMARDGIADFAYVNPGYQPGRFPIIAAGELPFLISNANRRLAALDDLVSQLRRQGDEGRAFLLRLRARSRRPSTRAARRSCCPADINGMKIRPADAHHRPLVTLLGGTNVQASAPEARDVLERGVADAITFPWNSIVLFGIDKVDQVPHGRAALCHDFRLGDEQGEIRRDVAGAEEGDRRPLHHRLGRARSPRPGPNGKRPAAPRSRKSPATRSTAHRRAARRVAQGGGAADTRNGPRAPRRRHRSRQALADAQGRPREIPIGLTSPARMTEMRRRSKHARRRHAATAQCDGSLHRWYRAARGDLRRHRRRRHLRLGLLRNFFSVSIPDSYDFGRLLLGILIFWGIAATSYRGTHITVDLVWAVREPALEARASTSSPRWCCCSS